MSLSIAELARGIPSLKPLIILIAGILVADKSDRTDIPWIIPALICFILTGVLMALENRYSFRARISQLLLSLLIFILSFGIAFRQKTSLPEYPSNTWITVLKAYPIEKQNSYLLKLDLISCTSDSIRFPVNTGFYLYTTDTINNLRPGNLLVVRTPLKHPDGPRNPGEFNYAVWLERHKVYYTAFVRQGEVRRLNDNRSGMETIAARLSGYLISRMEEVKGERREKSVIRAIGLGDKTSLEKERKKEYSRAGAVHVMAVSGLHVGLLWMFLGYFFKLFGNRRSVRILSLITAILVLWSYAIITGLSPSVCRACLMFTLVNAGKLINRHSCTINTVVLSAFLLLILNPSLLYDLGFQFSYAAVLGILLFQQRIRNLFPGGKGLAGYLSDLLSVSLSAQVFTAALTLYYFHSFPLYFLFTNLIIIPLVTGMMITFLLSLLFLPMEGAYAFFSQLSIKITWLMNRLVEAINTLPSPVIEDVYISPGLMILLLIAPLLLLLYFYYRRFIHLLLLLLSVLFSGILILKDKRLPSNSYLVVYDTAEGPVSGINFGASHIIYAPFPEEEMGTLHYATSGFRIREKLPLPLICRRPSELVGIDSLRFLELGREGGFLFFSGAQTIAVIHGDCPGFLSSADKLKLDILVMLDPVSQEEVRKIPFSPDTLVCPVFYPEAGFQHSEHEPIEYHVWNISQKGAFVTEIGGLDTKKRANF